MHKADWQDRARYAFDNVMAKGTPALVGLLGLASAAAGRGHRNIGLAGRPSRHPRERQLAGRALAGPVADHGSRHDGRRRGQRGLPAADVPGHPRRHLPRQRLDQRADHRAGRSAGPAQQGAVPDPGARPHRAARLVRPGVHRPRRAGQGQRERTPPVRGHPGRPGPGRDGGDDPPATRFHRQHPGGLPPGQPAQVLRRRPGQPRDGPVDHRHRSARRRPRRRRDQDPAVPRCPDLGRGPSTGRCGRRRLRQPRGGAAGRWRCGARDRR